MIPAELLTRLILTIGIVSLGLAAYWIYNRLLAHRARKNSPDLPGARSGVPVVLYFTTPTCQPCKTVQRPAIQRLQERLGERLQVIEVNALEQPDLASRWGVFSVPTTFILDQTGRLRHVNHGVAAAEKLIHQVETAGSAGK